MLSPDHLSELNEVCEGEAAEHWEFSLQYVLLPGLRLPQGCTPAGVDALLSLNQRDGYPTRLFFAQQVNCKNSLNWNGQNVAILQRLWFAYSWNYVTNDGRPLEVLANHLKALQ